MSKLSNAVAPGLMVLVTLSAGLAGCERKEKVLDIETPAGEVEVQKTDDGDIEIDVNKTEDDDD